MRPGQPLAQGVLRTTCALVAFMEIRVAPLSGGEAGRSSAAQPPNGTPNGQGLPAHPRKPLRRRARVIGLPGGDGRTGGAVLPRGASMPHATWWTWAAMDVPANGSD